MKIGFQDIILIDKGIIIGLKEGCVFADFGDMIPKYFKTKDLEQTV